MKSNIVLALEAEQRGSRRGPSYSANSRTFLQIHNDAAGVFQKDVKGHEGCVNSVTFNDTEDLIASGGDDRSVFVWKTGHMILEERPTPIAVMSEKHRSNIFALEFAMGGNRLFSGGNDGLIMVHDLHTGQLVRKYDGFFGNRRYAFDIGMIVAIYGISASPIDENVFVAVSDSRNLSQFDLRSPKRVENINMGHRLISVMFNPAASNVLAVAGSDLVSVIDCRKSNGKEDLYDGRLTKFASEGSTAASWNRTGTGIGVMRNGATPLYFDLDADIIYKLEDSSGRYKNLHTIKSLDFMEDSVVAGSEDFRLYVWDVENDGIVDGLEKEEGFLVKKVDYSSRLVGHRSIPNQVKYSRSNRLLISSGVEKIVKCWSPMNFPGAHNSNNCRRVGSFHRLSFRDRQHEWRGYSSLRRLVRDPASPTGEDIETLSHFDDLIMRGEGPVDVGMSSSDEDNGDNEAYVNEVVSSNSSSDDDDDDVAIRVLPMIAIGSDSDDDVVMAEGEEGSADDEDEMDTENINEEESSADDDDDEDEEDGGNTADGEESAEEEDVDQMDAEAAGDRC